MLELISNYCKNYTEETLFKDMKKTKRFKSLRYRSTDKLDVIDWYLPTEDLYIEGKCRKDSYQGYIIEAPKYKSLMQNKNCWYLNSSPDGIFFWDLHDYIKYDTIWWQVDDFPKTSHFEDNELIEKCVGNLCKSRATYITAEVLLYPFDKNRIIERLNYL